MKERSKDLLKNSFGSLISNDRALAAAKTAPLWLTILMFFLAVLVPVIPITTYYASQNGSTIVKANSYGLKTTFAQFALEMYKDDKSLVIGEDKLLKFDDASDDPIYTCTNELTNLIELRVYKTSRDTKAAKNPLLKELSEFKQLVKEANEEEKTDAVYSKPSFMVFFKDAYFLRIVKPGTETAVAELSGDYKQFKADTDLFKFFVEIKDRVVTKPGNAAEIKNMLATDKEVEDGIFNNYKSFLNKTYQTGKNKNVLFGTLIFAGIYLGLSLLMAFIIWLLTRGKNNPFNYLSLLATFKIESWVAIAPALIGLILGLVLPVQFSIKMMFFIAPLGFRVMFLLTKQLRPMQ